MSFNKEVLDARKHFRLNQFLQDVNFGTFYVHFYQLYLTI